MLVRCLVLALLQSTGVAPILHVWLCFASPAPVSADRPYFPSAAQAKAGSLAVSGCFKWITFEVLGHAVLATLCTGTSFVVLEYVLDGA